MAVLARPRALTFPRPGLNLRGDTAAGLVAGLIVTYLVAVPMAVLLFSSLRDTSAKLPFEDTVFTLGNYVTVFTSSTTYKLLLNTLGYAAGALVIGIGLGGTFAWFLTRARAPWRTFLTLCCLSAMATPPVTDAMAWALLASPSIGLLNAVIHNLTGTSGQGPLNVYSVGGMAFVQGMKAVPSAFILMSGSIARFDPTLEDAAQTNGAPGYKTLTRITLPLLRPALLGSAILFTIFLLEAFEIPAILGLPSRIFVFSSLIFDASHPAIGLPNYGLISAYASVFLAVAAVLVLAYSKATAHREQFAVITGKGYRPRQADLGKLTYVFVGAILLYFVLAVVLPFLSLLWTSLGLAYRSQELGSLALANLNAYATLLQTDNLHRAAVNTLVVSATAATATMLLASGVAWLSARHKGAAAAAPDRLTMLVFATPAIVVGLALIFFYAWLPLPIYGTIWIIVIGLSTRFLSYGTRLMSAAYLQVNKELEEASWLSGAAGLGTIRRVVFPLVWPSISGGWLWVFVHALRDSTLALMLFTVANDTLGVRLWTLWFQEGKPAQAAAMAVCLAIVSAVLSIGVIRTTIARPESV